MKCCPTCLGEGVVPDASDARKRRESAGASLRQVAAAMGISAMYLSDLERGNRTWSGDLWQRFCRVTAILKGRP